MSENRYITDDSLSKEYYDSDGISAKTLIVGAAAILGGKALYKNGLAKDVISNTIDNLAQRKPSLSIGFNTMRRWLLIDDLDIVEKDSVFRQSLKDVAVKVIKQDPGTASKMIEATKKDFDFYLTMLDQSIDAAMNNTNKSMMINSYTNTSLLNSIKTTEWEVNKFTQGIGNSKKALLNKGYDYSINSHYMTDEELNEQIKRTGYKPATITDLFYHETDDKGYTRLFEKTEYDFSSGQYGDIPKRKLEKIINSTILNDEGHKVFNGSKEAKFKDIYNINNIILDKDLLISEEKKIADMRIRKREFSKLVNNLSTEWKIPFININPLSLVGLDKFGRSKVNIGFVSEDSIAPAITGIRGIGKENTIANAKKTNEKLKDINEGIFVVDGNVYTPSGDGIKKIDFKTKKDIIYISKERAHSSQGFTHSEMAQVKMYGLTNSEYEEYTKDDGWRYLYQNIAKTLDIGRQEGDINKSNFSSMLDYASPDSYIEKLISKVTSKISPYKSKNQYNNYTQIINPNAKTGSEDTILLTNRAINLKDLKVNNFNSEMIIDYVKQHFADFNSDPELINNRTGISHFMIDRLNSTISNVGLGMSVNSSSGPVASATNLILKRFLPIYGAYHTVNVLNAFTEGEDENGQRTNLTRTVMEGVSRFDIGVGVIRDKLGITNFTKNLSELTPGNDQIEELPLINKFNLGESAQERADYWNYGKDPVRKSRYWALNTSTSFTGGKVEYYKLNPLQAAKSDAKFSDSQFGSRKEYYLNILNPYHYDKKHYDDRPYLMTSPAFENVPIFGKVLSGTVGRVVKPQIRMHEEYWNNDKTAKTSMQLKDENTIQTVNNNRMVSSTINKIMLEEAGALTINTYNSQDKQQRLDKFAIAIEKTKATAANLIYKLRESNKTEINLANEDKSTDVEEKVVNMISPLADPSRSEEQINKKRLKEYKEQAIREGITNKEITKQIKNKRNITNTQEYTNIDGLRDSVDESYNSLMNSKIMQEPLGFKYNYIPTKEYTSEQVRVNQNSRRYGNIRLQTNNKSPIYSVSNPYYQSDSTVSVNERELGAVLGKDREFDKIIKYDEKYDLSYTNMAYKTASGKIQIINTGREVDPLTSVNLKKESPQSFIDYKASVGSEKFLVGKGSIEKFKEENIEMPNGLSSTIKNQISDFANVAGIYGFGATASVSGDIQKGRTVIDTPSYSRSFNKTFWDEDLGGAGGDLSEIFRRLVQKRQTTGVNYYNPIKNTMPNWLPGEEGFINFQEGDPYAKIKKGEERLPGEGYERAYGINVDDYKITSSAIGKSKEDLVKYFLKRDDITEKWQQDIVKKGTKMHERVERYLAKNYLTIDSEVEISDRKNNISGIYDVRIKDVTAESGQAIIDMKTISAKGYEEVLKTGKPKEEHMRQVNFYLHNTNQKNNGGILYINRDDPTQMHMINFKYSKGLYEDTIKNVNEARNEVKNAIASNQISRSERYEPIDKLRILADVAPYSDEFNNMLKYVRSMDLSEDKKKEVKFIEDMAREQRRPLRTYDYRFKTADVTSKHTYIKNQVDDDKFMTSDFDEPIKLAGVKLPNKTDNIEAYNKTMRFINKYISGGVEIKVAKDEHLRNNKDSLKTINAVVYANGMNINKELIKRGLAEEDKEDYSAAGVHARFNSLERNFGSAWETLAHQNTIINNKILRVRTAKEDYERQQVYGKDFKDWSNPISDFIMPMLWGSASDETLLDRTIGLAGGALIGRYMGIASNNKTAKLVGTTVGAVLGTATGTSVFTAALIGSFFGNGVGQKSKFGKLIGASVGASLVIGSKVYKTAYEVSNGKEWIPKEKRRENETLEYLDKLEFVKNRRLYEVYAKKALVEDNIDVKEILSNSEEKAEKTKMWKNKIKKIKREQKKKGRFNTKEFEKAGIKFDKNDKLPDELRYDEASIKEEEDISKREESLKELRKKKIEILKNNTVGSLKEFAENKFNFKEASPSQNEEYKILKQRIKEKEKVQKQRTKEHKKNSKNRKERALEHTVNERITNAENKKELTLTSHNAMKAIEYYNKAEETMYGYDPGENITSFIKALPKKDRKYFNEFTKATKKERKEILDIAPDYMKRALQSSYGLEVDEKEDLSEYFSNHYLPDENWDGWQENYDSDAIKVKVISKEGFNLASHDIWQDDKIKADTYGETPLPNMDYRTKNINLVKSQLEALLGSAGLTDLEIDFMPSKNANINLKVYEDKKRKFEERLKERVENY